MIEGQSAAAEGRYLGAISEAVGYVADEFRKEPASFLYEMDLQGLLFARLFDQLKDLAFPWLSGDKHWSRVAGGRKLVINPVKTEYPSGRRFDIALIEPGPKSEGPAWDLHVRAAIEIKFWQADGSGGGYDRDCVKLKNYAEEAELKGRRFTGVCAVFCHRGDEPFTSEWFSDGVKLNPTDRSLESHGVAVWAFTPKARSISPN
jgi:hypothetical protein